MANKDPSKTEKPTSKRINDARNDGNVMTSPDITSVGSLIGGIIIIAVSLTRFTQGYEECLRAVINQMSAKEEWDAVAFQEGASYSIIFLGRMLLPIMLVVSLFAFVAIKAQVGSYFSLQPLKWKLDGLNPVTGMKQVLPNVKNTVKLGLVLLKVAVVGLFVYDMITNNLEGIIALPTVPFFEGLSWIGYKLIMMCVKILLFFTIIAILDYIYKRYEYYENLKMSKQEVKDEHKNSEGDPKVKAKIRQKMMQAAMMRMGAQVPQADVVVTNPTHVAVAIVYTPGTFAPRVLAKGLRKRAQSIKEIARRHDIPIIEAPPLARSLYRHTKAGSFIPEHLFSAVAMILAKIHARKYRNQPAVRTNISNAAAQA